MRDVSLGWKEFSQAQSDSRRATIFIPGWGYNERSTAIEPLCRALAKFSRAPTFAVRTRGQRVVRDSFSVESESIVEFIVDRAFDDVLLVGHSIGGCQAIHLARRLQQRSSSTNVQGLILFDPSSLYTQSHRQFVANYLREMFRSHGTQNALYLLEGLVETAREIVRSHVTYPRRLRNELAQITSQNPDTMSIEAPVILVFGARDLLFQPQRLIPSRSGANQPNTCEYLMSFRARETLLRQHLFPRSPYIRMLVGRTQGHHGLATSRPEAVARVAIYLLERWKRQQQTDPEHSEVLR